MLSHKIFYWFLFPVLLIFAAIGTYFLTFSHKQISHKEMSLEIAGLKEEEKVTHRNPIFKTKKTEILTLIDEKLKWNFKVETANYALDDDKCSLQNVDGSLYNNNIKTLSFTASNAVLKPKIKDLVASLNIKAEMPNRNLKFESGRLSWLSASKKLIADKKILVKTKNLSIETEKMTADPAMKKLFFSGPLEVEVNLNAVR